jgi:DNA-binding NarL/FixJ family response regulator
LLSDREYEVMRMIATGTPLTDIGEKLNVSVKTISSYRARIMEKMQMKSNAELTRYAIANKLID